MNSLQSYNTKKLSALKENLDDLDLSAKEELDGSALEDEESDIESNEPDLELDIGNSDENVQQKPQEYNLNHVSSQLDGMVEHWFQLAQELPPEKKENFLKLGERLSEIVEVIQSEFMNG